MTAYYCVSFVALSTQGNGLNFWSEHCIFSFYSSQTLETVQYRSVNINNECRQYLNTVD